MTSSLITKKRIAKSLKYLMNTVDFEKISVSLIMEHAGIRRQTFYNYFLDKYDLLEWIFNTELKEQVTDNLEYISGYQLLKELFRFFYSNRKFYKRLFQIVDQNDFNTYFNKYCRQTVEKFLSEYRISPFFSQYERNFFISYHSAALIDITKLILNSAYEDYKKLSQNYIKMIKIAIENY